MTFHNNSLLLKDPNGSLCVYDGADGSQSAVNPTQTTLTSEIAGQQTVYGMFQVNYWSAVIIWAIKLPMDLRVDGTVNMDAYISSNSKISGSMSGGGYGMGLVDIDQNNNEVQEFITQAPYTQGSNPFTSTPTQYSVSTNVDYTFKAGHSIGFAVGVGATTQGFTATVYFDSSNYNSGATLPVVDASGCQTFTANNQNVAFVSDSAVSNCQYNAAANSIQFNAAGINYTTGYCNVSVPKALMQSPLTVTSNAQQITSTTTENSTYYQLYFTHTVNANPLMITGTALATSPTSTASSPTTPAPPAASSAPAPQQTNQPTTNQPPTTSTAPSATNQTTTTPTTQPTNTPPLPETLFVSAITILACATLTAVWFKRRLAKKPMSTLY